MRFSVIVPIYKVEPYLRQCVDSVLAQTYRDFELILVDDGSPDGCPAICDEYAVKDTRVKVIHKPNGGLVSARQAGLQAAQGEYIAPVDGDDWVAPDFLDQAAKILDAYDVDMVSFGFARAEENGKTRALHEIVPEGFYDRARKEAELWPRMLMSQSTERLSGSMWSKVYRRTLILPHQMAVDQRLFMGEDAACILPVYRDAASIYISYKTAYYYRTRSGSMTHSFQPAQLESVRLLFQAIEKLDGVPGFDEQIDRFALYTGAYIMERTIYSQTNRDQYQTMVWDFFMQPNRFYRLRRARFTAGTPKMLGAFFLIRHRWKKLTFAYLSACMYLKSLGLKELLIRLRLWRNN